MTGWKKVHFNGEDLLVDNISEYTTDAGVYVDGVHFKDKMMTIDPEAVISNYAGALTISTNTEQTNGNSALLRIRNDNPSSIGKSMYIISDGGNCAYFEQNAAGIAVQIQSADTAHTGLSLNGILKADNLSEFTTDNGMIIESVTLKDGNIELNSGKIITTSGIIKNVDTDTIGIRNAADDDYGNLNVDGILCYSGLTCDNLFEKTVGHGVDIDGINVKDNIITCDQIIARQFINTDSTTALLSLKYSDGSYVRLRNPGSGTFSIKVNNDNILAFSIASDGVTTFDQEIKTDAIGEKTGASGVTIDGVSLKDSGMTGSLKECSVTTDTPGTPAEGHLRWDSTNHRLESYNGTAWEDVGTGVAGGGGSTPPPIQLTPRMFHLTDCSEGTDNYAPTIDFGDSATESARVTFMMPSNYDGGTFTIRLWWLATATTGNVRWVVRLEGNVEGEDIVPESGEGSSYSGVVLDAVQGTSEDLGMVDFTVSSNQPDAGDFVSMRIDRIGGHGDDTMSGDARFLLANVIYSTS